MNLKFEQSFEQSSEQSGSRAIVYDADCIQQPGAEMFDAEYWRQQGAIRQTAPGRGNALMLETPFGPVVMRACLRGGWAANFSRDRYLFTGFERSRPLAEVRMLAEMTRLGLPVPQPIAGQCLRRGLSYTGVLLTRRIRSVVPLADLLDKKAMEKMDWVLTGQCIRRFHDAGVIHPDLNARNVLIGNNGEKERNIYLVDFDRACFRPGSKRLFNANLKRLHRSLRKIWPVSGGAELESCWEQLMKGYNRAI